jgi:hypothetical protein
MLVLWIGALVFHVVDRFLKPQDQGAAEAIVLALALGLLLRARAQVDVPLYFGRRWADLAPWGMPPFLIASQASWLLSLLMLLAALLASLASQGRVVAGRTGRLAALGAALLFLCAGDWATLAAAWVLTDVCMLHVLQAGGAGRRTLQWTAVFSLGGAAVLGTALLLWRQSGGSAWVDRGGILPVEAVPALRFPPRVAGLLALAAVTRLMPFPLPTWQGAAPTDQQEDERPLAQVTWFGVPTMLGAYLWVRLAQWGVIGQAGGWALALALWGGLALLLGALWAWGARNPRDMVASLHVHAAGTVLLGAGLTLPPGWQLVLAVHVLLGLPVIYLSWTYGQHFRMGEPRSYPWILPAGLAILSLAGLPLTVGFPARVALYQGVFAARKWASLLLMMAAESLSLGALLRILFDLELVGEETEEIAGAEEGNQVPGQRAARISWKALRREIGYLGGGVLALGILVLGVAPQLIHLGAPLPGLGRWFALPTLPIWAALLLPLIGAVGIYRSRDQIARAVSGWWPLAHSFLDFQWLYRGVETVLQRLGSTIWGGTQVIEGAGYMAWVVLICLLIVLFVISL